ncbi:hypothetical protein F5877DRAFT_71942 [Lentinula edodes]|nr:hypothetical protein F5877DRAFT_71942 [Lentinula edodes]
MARIDQQALFTKGNRFFFLNHKIASTLTTPRKQEKRHIGSTSLRAHLLVGCRVRTNEVSNGQTVAGRPHHTRLPPVYMNEMKKYHLAHHCKNFDLGFDMGLEKHGVDKYQISSAKGMVAIGDVQGKALLTPVAIAAARRLANKLFGPKKFKDDKLSYEDIPTVVSSYASIGTVILTEPQKVIGIHIIGMGSNEAMQGFGVAVKMGVRKQDLDDISRVTCRVWDGKVHQSFYVLHLPYFSIAVVYASYPSRLYYISILQVIHTKEG